MEASGDPSQGNIKGLPRVKTRDELTNVLTSLLYRVNVHGAGTLRPPWSSRCCPSSRFPPSLQSAVIPEPDTS